MTVNVDSAVVVLRGLSINGLGGTYGIRFTGQTRFPHSHGARCPRERDITSNDWSDRGL